MKFAEFHVGQVIEAGPYQLGQEELRRFAEAYDPQWFHVDPDAAAHGPFGGIIASGWHTCSIAMRLAVDAILTGSESFASPGVAYIKWPNPVRAGDSLTLKAEVLETRRSRSSRTSAFSVALAGVQSARAGGSRKRGDQPVRSQPKG